LLTVAWFPFNNISMATNENLKHEVTEHGRWVECSCGAGEYLPKQLRHRRACRSCAQWTDTPVAIEAAPVAELQTFAADVRRTGLTKGRDEDVLQAVRRKHLSMSDAMNSDD
jgi:hypothetical protein